jgi:hypothetical protein
VQASPAGQPAGGRPSGLRIPAADSTAPLETTAVDGSEGAMSIEALKVLTGAALKQQSHDKARRVLFEQVKMRPTDGRIWHLVRPSP